MTECYAAKMKDIPGFVAGVVNRPEYAKATAEHVAKWIMEGYEIVGVSSEEFKAGFGEYQDYRNR